MIEKEKIILSKKKKFKKNQTKWMLSTRVKNQVTADRNEYVAIAPCATHARAPTAFILE